MVLKSEGRKADPMRRNFRKRRKRVRLWERCWCSSSSWTVAGRSLSREGVSHFEAKFTRLRSQLYKTKSVWRRFPSLHSPPPRKGLLTNFNVDFPEGIFPSKVVYASQNSSLSMEKNGPEGLLCPKEGKINLKAKSVDREKHRATSNRVVITLENETLVDDFSFLPQTTPRFSGLIIKIEKMNYDGVSSPKERQGGVSPPRVHVLMKCSCISFTSADNLPSTPDEADLGFWWPWLLGTTLSNIDEKTGNDDELLQTVLDNPSDANSQVRLNGLLKSKLAELRPLSLFAPRLSPSTSYESEQPGVSTFSISVLSNFKCVFEGSALAAPQPKGVLQKYFGKKKIN